MCQSIDVFAKSSAPFRKLAKITDVEVNANLAKASDWTLDEDKISITRTFKFCNFVEAVGFMNDTAFIAESLNHHPE